MRKILLLFLIVTLFLTFIPSLSAQDFGSIEQPKLIDWAKFWSLFNAHTAWDLEYNNGSGWISAKYALRIQKNYRIKILDQETPVWVEVPKNMASTCKITLNFTAPYIADYRLTFGIDLDVKNYTHKSGSWNYTISYKNYTVLFDWSDIKEIPNLVVSHGVKPIGDEIYFWFRIRRDNIPKGANIILDPSFGNENQEAQSLRINDYIRGNAHTCPETGTADSITVYLIDVITNCKTKCAIYKKSDDSLIGTTQERSDCNGDGWYTFNFADPKPSLTNQEYVLCVWGDAATASHKVAYAGVSIYRYFKGETYNGFPNPFDGTTGEANYKYSIYCNYTISGQDLSYSFGETVAITDSLETRKEKKTSFTDTILITDSFSYSKFLLRTFSDTVTITESFSLYKNMLKTFSETTIITDVFTILKEMRFSFTDLIEITDSITKTQEIAGIFQETFTETHIISDLLNIMKEKQVILSDIAVITDSLTYTKQMWLAIYEFLETITITDQANFIEGYGAFSYATGLSIIALVIALTAFVLALAKYKQ